MKTENWSGRQVRDTGKEKQLWNQDGSRPLREVNREHTAEVTEAIRPGAMGGAAASQGVAEQVTESNHAGRLAGKESYACPKRRVREAWLEGGLSLLLGKT